jgi:hypothetical protein
MNSDKSIPTNVDKMLWSVSRYIGYVVFTKYGDSIFCEVPSHIVAIPELGTSVGIGSFSGEQRSERAQEFRRMKGQNTNKCYQLRDFGKKDFIQRYINKDFAYTHDCDSGLYEYSPEMLAKMHGPTERIVADIKQITATGAYVYVINNVAYPSQFPVQWALTPIIETTLCNDDAVNTVICGPGTSPEHCGNCNISGSYRGIFLGYCANCAMTYNMERGFGYITNGVELELEHWDLKYVMQSKYPCSASFDDSEYDFNKCMYEDEYAEIVRKIYKSTKASYLKGVDISTLGYTENIEDICLPGGLPPTGPDICDNQEDMDPVREDEIDTNILNQKTWVSNRYPRRAYGTPQYSYREVLCATQTDTFTPNLIREKMEILFAHNNISVSDNNYSFPIGPRESWDHYRIEKRPTCWFGWNAILPSTHPDEEDVELCIRLYVSNVHTAEAPAELVLECNNVRGRSSTYWELMNTMKAWILGETEDPVIHHIAPLYIPAAMDDYDSEEEIKNEAKIAPEEMENNSPLNNIFMASSML